MSDGGRAAAGLWVRADLRRRWRSLVALGVLIGLTAGFAVAALAGARRTHTALPRLKQETNAATAAVFATQSGVTDPDFAKLRTRPEVKDLAVWDLAFGNIDGDPSGVLFASDNGRWGTEVSGSVLIAGRMWAPNAPDEVVVDEIFAKQGARIGRKFTFALYGPTFDDLVTNNQNGPKVTLTVVGVVRTVSQFLFATDGQAFLSPGFVQRYRGQGAIYPNADVIVRNSADVATLRQDVNEIIGPGTPVLDVHAVERRVNTTLSVERSALGLLALAVAIAGGLLVAQALTRSAATVGDDALVLRAVGLSRWDIAMAGGVSHTLTALVACAVTATTAIVASRWFPVGLGRRIDPDVGFHADWVTLGPGLLITVVLTIGGAMLVAARTSSSPAVHTPRRASLIATRIRRRAPLTIGLGATLAFDRGRGRTSIPVFPALVGSVVGVLGVIGALTISSGLRDSLVHPERAGVTWDLSVTLPPEAYTSSGLKPEIGSAIRKASSGMLALVTRELVPVNGVGVPTFSVRPTDNGATPISFRLITGRAPHNADEVAIGPATARDVHAKVGDTIQLGDTSQRTTIVGEALFPNDVHSEFDEGVWVTPARIDQLFPTHSSADRLIAIRLPPGANQPEIQSALQNALPRGTSVGPAEVPAELANLRNVRTLPVVLAGFLALLAVGALTHVLQTSARRRSHDFAVLRALGLNRGRARLILNSQATAISLVGLVIGVPLGIVLGRTLWRLVTDRVPLANVPPFAVVGVVLIVPITIVLANALALWPGQRVARLHPAEVLREE